MNAVESDASFIAAVDSQSDTHGARRLVIRIVLPKDSSFQPPAPQGVNRRALLLPIAGAAALLLGWLGVSVFRSEPAPAPTDSSLAQSRNAAPADADSLPHSLNSEAASAALAPEPVSKQAEIPLTPVNEVIPEPSRSALNTIRGTIRVSVQVDIDPSGAVIGATTREAGPSRYFERKALEASRQWTFSPANTEQPRTMLLRFHFTRGGVTAHANG